MFLKNKDGRMVIRLSDTTTHGGRVITCSDNWTVDGRPVARVGDMVMCPQCNNQAYPIVQGDETITQDSRPVAFEGHLTACGAQLISSLRGTQPAMQNAVYRPAQESARAMQHSYTDSGARTVDISDIRVHRSPIFRPHDPTDEVVLVMINNNGIGHAGLMIGEGQSAVLYDPGGSYTGCYQIACRDGSPTYRGSDDTFTSGFFEWSDYLAYQRADGPKVNIYQFVVSQEHAQMIRERIKERAGTNPPYCATAIAAVLKKSGGEFSELSDPLLIRSPWGLEQELKDILYPGRGGLIPPAY